MAKRRRRSARGSRSTARRAQTALGELFESGTRQVNERLAAFLSLFDTSHLIAALQKQAQAASRALGARPGRRRGPGRPPGRKRRRVGRPRGRRSTRTQAETAA